MAFDFTNLNHLSAVEAEGQRQWDLLMTTRVISWLAAERRYNAEQASGGS